MRPRPPAGTARIAPHTAQIIAPPNAPVKRARGTSYGQIRRQAKMTEDAPDQGRLFDKREAVLATSLVLGDATV